MNDSFIKHSKVIVMTNLTVFVMKHCMQVQVFTHVTFYQSDTLENKTLLLSRNLNCYAILICNYKIT